MLEVCPMTLKEANTYVEQHHRHYGAVVGHKLIRFSKHLIANGVTFRE